MKISYMKYYLFMVAILGIGFVGHLNLVSAELDPGGGGGGDSCPSDYYAYTTNTKTYESPVVYFVHGDQSVQVDGTYTGARQRLIDYYGTYPNCYYTAGEWYTYDAAVYREEHSSNDGSFTKTSLWGTTDKDQYSQEFHSYTSGTIKWGFLNLGRETQTASVGKVYIPSSGLWLNPA